MGPAAPNWHSNSKFCNECGAPVTQASRSAEYKQVTVLFADVVHSMDIASAVGAERLREIMTGLLDRATAVVTRYGGTLDKFTGDGIMARVRRAGRLGGPRAAGVPGTRWRSRVASADLADEVPTATVWSLQLRIGLNSGQVIAGEIGFGRVRVHRDRGTGRHGPADGVGGSAGWGDAQRLHRPAGRDRRKPR